MKLFQFGAYVEGKSYKSVDEHAIRTSATLLLFIALLAFTNGFMLKNFWVLPYFTGFIALNFFIGVVVDPKYAPTMIIAAFINRKKDPLYIGGVQKHFAWSLGLILTLLAFIFSLLLQGDVRFFEPVCFLCIVCITLLYFEAVLGVCVGCKLYQSALDLGILKQPKERPNCMGNGCDVKKD